MEVKLIFSLEKIGSVKYCNFTSKYLKNIFTFTILIFLVYLLEKIVNILPPFTVLVKVFHVLLPESYSQRTEGDCSTQCATSFSEI